MKKSVLALVLAVYLGSCLVAVAQSGSSNGTQARASRKMEKQQLKAQKKYTKAEKKRERQMAKSANRDRKNSHYPKHSY